MIALWHPRWSPTGEGPLDNEALGNELKRAAVASHWAEQIRSGRADWVFEPGAKITYTAAPEIAPATGNRLQSSKFIAASDTNNANDFISLEPTENDATFERIQIPTACQAITNGVGLAAAIMWAVSFRVGTVAAAASRTVRHPSSGVIANQVLLRDDSFVLANDENVGFPIVCPHSASPAGDNVIGLGYTARSVAVIRNIYNSALGGYYVQFRVGTNAGGENGGGAADPRVSLRLMGYYV